MDTDVVVVGLGAMGTAAALAFARAGARVIGLEAEPVVGHAVGSSHGESRIIRQAYFEDPAYVPLVQEAWDGWQKLERDTGASLLTRTGGLMIGRPEADVVAGSVRSARLHGLSHELLSANEARRRFGQFRWRDDELAVFEPMAGVLRPEVGVRLAADEARAKGADLRWGRRVTGITSDGRGVRVVCSDGGAVRASWAVLAVGAWSNAYLGDRLKLQVERQVQLWFPWEHAGRCTPATSPVFIHEAPGGGQYYGFPSLDGQTMKVARHHGGQVTEPDRLARGLEEDDWRPLLDEARELVPGLRDGPPTRAAVCMYTNSPDGHFIVGRHPERAQIVVLAGFSGHGFKFAPAIGRLARDLVLGGAAPLPLFDPARFL